MPVIMDKARMKFGDVEVDVNYVLSLGNEVTFRCQPVNVTDFGYFCAQHVVLAGVVEHNKNVRTSKADRLNMLPTPKYNIDVVVNGEVIHLIGCFLQTVSNDGWVDFSIDRWDKSTIAISGYHSKLLSIPAKESIECT